jgi:PST family polysaccharide transporter
VVRRNVSWMMADKVVRMVVGLAINVWIVRYLGASALGLLGFTQSVVSILAILSQLGLETILVRELVRRPQDERTLLGSALALRLGGAVLTLALAVTAIAGLRPGDADALALALVFGSAVIAQAFDVIELWFQSRSRVVPYVVGRAVAFALASGARVAVLMAHAPLPVIGLAIAVEVFLGAAALVVALRLQGDAPRRWRAERATAGRLFSESWPLMLNSVASLLAIRIDQTMLTLMQGVHENGIYAAAQRLTEVVFFIPLAVASAAAPTLLRSHARDRAEYERRRGRVFTLLGWGAIAIALPVSLLADWIAVALFGSAFRDSGPVLALHIWSTPGLFMGVAITNWFIAEGRQGGLMLRSVLAAALNVVLNLGLIPAFGARGAALATLLSLTFAYVFANALFPSTRPLFRLQMRALLLPGARPERP